MTIDTLGKHFNHFHTFAPTLRCPVLIVFADIIKSGLIPYIIEVTISNSVLQYYKHRQILLLSARMEPFHSII